jgi:hypothetical protein
MEFRKALETTCPAALADTPAEFAVLLTSH